MSASFSNILPPPQTIDTLDTWGDLDSLLWSLDSDVWTKCGVYGFTATEKATTGQNQAGIRIRSDALSVAATASGSVAGIRKRTQTLKISAKTSQKFTPYRVRVQALAEASKVSQSVSDNRVRCNSCAASSTTGQGVLGVVTRSIPVDPASAEVKESESLVRIRTGASGSFSAIVSEKSSALRIRQDQFADNASTSEKSSPVRARLLSGTVYASTGADFALYRVISSSMMESESVSDNTFNTIRIRQDSCQAAANCYAECIPYRVLNYALASNAVGLQTAECNIVATIAGSTKAESYQDFYGGIIHSIPVEAAAMAIDEKITLDRIRFADFEECKAYIFEGLSVVCVRTGIGQFGGKSEDECIIYRILDLNVIENVVSGESIQPEYKGWTWKGEDRANTDWEQEPTVHEVWSALSSSSADWERQDDGTSVWTPIPSNTGNWRGVTWQ